MSKCHNKEILQSQKENIKCLICWNREQADKGKQRSYNNEIIKSIWQLGIAITPFFEELKDRK